MTEQVKTWAERAVESLDDPARARVLLNELFEKEPDAACVALMIVLVTYVFFTDGMTKDNFKMFTKRFTDNVIKTKDERGLK
jgi:hypothetical protein